MAGEPGRGLTGARAGNVYDGLMGRGAWTGPVVVLLGGCFRGEFLDNTCERLDRCGASSAGSSTSLATTDAPTSSGGASSTGDGLVELPYFALRINSVALVDPNLYASFLDGGLCTNVRKDLSGLVNAEIASGESNLVIAAALYDPDAAQFNFGVYQNPTCDVAARTCTIPQDPAPPPFPAVNIDAGECLPVDTAVINPANVPELRSPTPPCFVTPAGSFSLKLGDNLGFIALTAFQMSASYAPDELDPAGLTDGLIRGFIREQDALDINYDLNGLSINLWSVIAGSGHPDECATENMFASDVDLIDLTGPDDKPDGVPETRGVWLFLNFTAERVTLLAGL